MIKPPHPIPPALQQTPAESLRRQHKLLDLLEAEMKFSHSIQFNAVPDWSSHYISYSNLKKLIYQLEKASNQAKAGSDRANRDAEASPLLSQTQSWGDDPDRIFTKKLDEEMEKVCEFFRLKELEIHSEVDGIMQDVEEFQEEHAAGEREGEGQGRKRQGLWARSRQQSMFKSFTRSNGDAQKKRRRSSTIGTYETRNHAEQDDSDEDEDDEVAPLNKSQHSDRRPSTRGRDGSHGGEHPMHKSDVSDSAEWRRRPSMAINDFDDDDLQALYDEGITLKKRITNTYVNVCELRSFIQLNEKGFTKVLKKYDKVLDRNLKTDWINKHVKTAHPFQAETMDALQEQLGRLEQAYAGIVTHGDVDAAKRELRLHLREHVVWERNTVWREMIGIERKAQAANFGIQRTLLGGDNDPKKARRQGDDEGGATKEVVTPVGRYRFPRFILTPTFGVLVACCVIFVVLANVPLMEKQEQQNCLALVVFVSLLWATEACNLTWPMVLRC